MKNVIVALAVALTASAVAMAQPQAVDTARLMKAYDTLMTNPSNSDDEMAFFSAFPSDWYEYIATFKYSPDGESQPAELPLDGLVEAFTVKLSSVPDSLYCAKAVNLAIGAMPGVDVPNSLRLILERALETRPDGMYDTLGRMTLADRTLFWQFYWSTPYRHESTIKAAQALVNNLIERGHRQEAQIMAQAFNTFCGHVVYEGHIDMGRYEADTPSSTNLAIPE